MSPVSTSAGTDGVLDVVLHGEIDYTNAAEVTRQVRDAVERTKPAGVRVDMAAVTFLDSSGIGMLVSGMQLARALGADFRVTGPRPRVFDQLQLTGLVEMFPVERASGVS